MSPASETCSPQPTWDALRLVGHAELSDGPALAAGWIEVLNAGYEVLAAIPTPTVGRPSAAGGDYLRVRVAQMVSHVGYSRVERCHRGWPLGGSGWPSGRSSWPWTTWADT